MNSKKTVRFTFLSLLMTFIFFSSTSLLATTKIEPLPTPWKILGPILLKRLTQKSPKMKLTLEQVNAFVLFLDEFKSPAPNLQKLATFLPKTTLELLMAIQFRNLPLNEAEGIAEYLETLVKQFNFKNPNAFDENTSHIIGREWHEIDYSGENMTWQKQKSKYERYGIQNFKTLANVKKFFPVESQLPYFKKIYQHQNSPALEKL